MIKSFLSKKYPFPDSKHWIGDCAFYCGIVFLILYFLQPFGFSYYSGNKILASALFAVVAFRCITDSLGYFSFTTKKTGVVTLCASLLGYEEYARKSELDKLRGIRITLHEQAATIDDVVVTASTYSMGKSYQFKFS